MVQVNWQQRGRAQETHLKESLILTLRLEQVSGEGAKSTAIRAALDRNKGSLFLARQMRQKEWRVSIGYDGQN